MSARRVTVLVTCTVVAVLAVVFAVGQWDRTSRVATVVSALAAVASVGVGVWAALPGSTRTVRASQTGPATAGLGGIAVSGVAGRLGGLPTQIIEVEATGHADASNGGEAVTGFRSS